MLRKTNQPTIITDQKTEGINITSLNPATNNIHADTPKKTYRTRKKAGEISEIPNRLPVITNQLYQNALTFNKNINAYLQPLYDISQMEYRNGILLLKGLPATSTELSSFYTQDDESIEAFNLSLLRALYGIILSDVPDSLPEGRVNDKTITIYYSDFSRKIGKSPNIGKSDVMEFIHNIRLFENVIGIIDNGTNGSDLLPVIVFKEYNAAKNTISFSSPYMIRVIKDIFEASIKKNKKGLILLKKNGKPQMLPSHSYLIDMSIAKERNKKAVEIVFIIVTLIEQSGNNIPHIRAKTIIERNLLLNKSLDGQTSSNKSTLLKRAFSKAWLLLRTKTFLTDTYTNIQLPDPQDATKIPTVATLDMVFKFPHDGKSKNA